MNFVKLGDEYINLNHVASITESGANYILYWTDHNGKAKQTVFTKDSNEGKAFTQFLRQAN
jgi:hypothetical protein